MEECFSNCKFQDPCKTEVDTTYTCDTFNYVKCEEIDIKCEPFEAVSRSVVKDERHTQIKGEVKDEYSDSENADSQIATEAGEVNGISTVEDIKSEEIDIKSEPIEDIRLSCTENGETLFITHNRTCDEVIEQNDKLKYEDSNLVDSKTTEYSIEMEYKGDAEDNMPVNVRRLRTPMLGCNICPYNTRWRSNLLRHMLVHGDCSKIKMFACNSCPYKTGRKYCLRRHMLVHTDPSNTPMFECNISTCTYKTQWKDYLRKHILVHTGLSKTSTFECNTCTYKTRRKLHLQSHMLLHMDPSKIPLYECYSCGYKAPRKDYLRKHIARHMKKLHN